MNITFKCIPFKAFSLEELYDVMAFRQKVFVVEQDCPYLDADGLDLIAYHVLGITKNKIIAYARLLPKGAVFDNYTLIGRVVTDNSVRNKGVGSKLMTESIHQIEQLFGKEKIKISAQYHLVQFYSSLGFHPIGEQYLEDNIPHIAMIKE